MRDEKSRTIDSKQAHPIQDESLDRTIKAYDADDLNRDRIHDTLVSVQQHLESEHLVHWLFDTRSYDPVSIECIYQDDNVWAFAVYDTPAWGDHLDEVGVEDSTIRSIVQDVHLFETQLLDTDQEGTQFNNDDTWDTFLIEKTPEWRDAEEEIRDYFSWLASIGCSPAQIIDYWMCEVLGETQSDWARKRHVSRTSINGNVGAANKIFEHFDEERDIETIDMKKKREDKPQSWELAEENIRFEIAYLTERGCSMAEALDYWACEMRDAGQTEWARRRGVNQSTVSGNVNDARDQITRKNIPNRSEIEREVRQDMEEANES